MPFGGTDWLKEGEGISQRIYMHDMWAWTMVWGWHEEVGVLNGGGKGEVGTTIIA